MGLKEGTRVPRLVKVAGLIGLVGVAATGCTTEEVLRFGWPEGVTPQAESMRQLWTWSVIAALAVGVIVWGLMFWSAAFHRKKTDELPRQFQYNVPLELIYTALPLVMVVVLMVLVVLSVCFVDLRCTQHVFPAGAHDMYSGNTVCSSKSVASQRERMSR